MQRILFMLLVAATPMSASAGSPADSPYAGMESRAIKALSDEQVRQYREGAGMGFAMAAELNGYPGPRHVLELGDEMELTDEQRASMQAIFDRMHAAAVGIGERIVELERTLDTTFRAPDASATKLAELTSEIATLQGRLRYTHLVAHIEARTILSRHQLHEYARLRGYANGAGPAHHGH